MMRSCDTCPGNMGCAATNLHPVLVQVFELYSQGLTDKFDILFSLSPDSEALLERFDDKVSPDCWSKAALLAIADIITTTLEGVDLSPGVEDTLRERINTALATAVDAFEHFPWAVSELVEQAPALYLAIDERAPGQAFADHLSKRNFIKLCKNVAYR